MVANDVLWNKYRDMYPNFANYTSKGTKEMFTERGWEAMKRNNPQAIDEFFGLSLMIMLARINASHAKDKLEDKGFGEYIDAPFGGIIQKMAVGTIKPVSPAYRKLQNGSSVDAWKVRKPDVNERFFKQNFDYQSYITIPYEYQKKVIFTSEYGMNEFMSAIMAGLQNGYVIQKFEYKLEALNKYLNSTEYPLKDTQKVNVTVKNDTPTTEELLNILIAIKNVITAMDLGPSTDAFNSMSYDSAQNIEDLKLLIRPGYKTLIETMLLSNAYNPSHLTLPVDIIEVNNFGGIEAYKDKNFTTKLFVVYDDDGVTKGYSETENGALYNGPVFFKDPNENVIALLADKRLLFEAKQEPYSVETIPNPRGMYTNYFCNCPNNTVAVDALYNAVVFNRVK